MRRSKLPLAEALGVIAITPNPLVDASAVEVGDALAERGDAGKACFKSLDQWNACIASNWRKPCKPKLSAQKKRLVELEALAEACRDLVKDVDLLCKLSTRLVDAAEKDGGAHDHDDWDGRAMPAAPVVVRAHRVERQTTDSGWIGSIRAGRTSSGATFRIPAPIHRERRLPVCLSSSADPRYFLSESRSPHSSARCALPITP
jgi:hypothetical protein